MALAPGTRIGVFEIEAQLGAGGMGAVYRARDTRLGREVAIKALPDQFAADAERVARFEREAQVLASLNHPHIATIHGLEEAEGAKFIVLELVQGQTLAERIAAGAMPVADALAIGRQILEALEAAHAKGIIHRDLKPANVMVTADGRVKVLDFGLAKAVEAGATADAANSPTLTFAPTGMGVILGTAGYMAPEQAKGRPADKRSDVWAFGCLFYEMLTGIRAFPGEDVTDTIAAIVRGEPDWSLLPPDLPPVTSVYLRRCLRKSPNERVQDSADLRLALEGAFDPPAIANGGVFGAGTPRPRANAAWLAAGAVILAVGATAVTWFVKPAPAADRAVRRFSVSVAPAVLGIANSNRDLAITPGGTRIVYFAGQGASRQLFVRSLDALAASPLRAAERWYEPFVSFDSRWIGFIDETDFVLRKMPVAGGPPVTIAAVGAELRGGTWGPDNTVVFAKRADAAGLWRVPASGGEPTALTTPDRARGEIQHSWPEFLPGGRAVLYVVEHLANQHAPEIAVVDLATGAHKILATGTNPKFSPSGHLLYVVEGRLQAIAFDPARLEVRGEAVPVLEDLLTKVTGGADFVLSFDGTLVYVGLSGNAVRRRLAWVDRSGNVEPIDAPMRAYVLPRISPDGSRLALDVRDQESDIWIWDVQRRSLTRLTNDAAFDGNPVWALDSRRVFFASTRSGPLNIYSTLVDGGGQTERVTDTSIGEVPISAPPGGKTLIVRREVPTSTSWLLPLEGPHVSRRLPLSTVSDRNAEVSPDGRWLAYDSPESGTSEVYVRPFPDVTGSRVQASSGGGSRPVWRRDGAELIYIGADNRLMSVAVLNGKVGASPVPAVTRPVFPSILAPGRTFDVSPDGKRFLIIDAPSGGDASAGAASMTVVLNWTEELKRRVPGR